ncbi:MAG: mercuric reductase [Gemmatimonadetes bacterium]|nr:mercuric reductase [Gemmatimonadota bacterium]
MDGIERADVVVVGCGQAGGPLSWRLAGTGRRVVLFERAHLGGTCVNYGCTPTKTMIASADVAHAARRGGDLGIDVDQVRVDLARVVARKEAMVRRWRSGVEEKVAAADGLTLVRAHARFVEPRVLEADGRRWSADTIILDPGARPSVPRIPGLESVAWLDNASVMELRETPDHLVVLGGGYIGCEMGQAFRRFGAAVTILERNDRILSREDEDVSEALQEAFAEEGIAMEMGAPAERVEATADGGVRVRLAGGAAVEGSHLLVALGRRPNTDDLGCDAGGVELDASGTIVIDDRYCTSADGVYAVGDATGGPQFTHASWDDHRILFDLLRGDDRRTRDDRIVPQVVFTDPQVARVGLSEREARERNVRCDVATLPFGHIARAIEIGRRAGLVKVLVDPDDDRVLGAAVVGDQAGELLHVFVVMMSAGAPVRALVDAEMAHPTFCEGLQSAVMTLERHALA